MKIGVVCEGPTDFPALESFLGAALAEQGLRPQFISLFPDMDRTRPEGGWAKVLNWLANNPPAERIRQYFQGGLFGGALGAVALDAIVIQLDADVLEDLSFTNFIHDRYGIDFVVPAECVARGEIISRVLTAAALFPDMTNADRSRHVIFPAVESTEAWCVAAFNGQPQNWEGLSGIGLVQHFMEALEVSEGRPPQAAYAEISKDLSRRKKFCEKHAVGFKRVLDNCLHFRSGCEQVLAVAPPGATL